MNELFSNLTELVESVDPILGQFLVVFMRLGAAISVMPAFGEPVIPQRVRLIVALAFCAIVAPATENLPELADLSIGYLLVETVIGLTLGIGVRLFTHALQIAGVMAAQATTLSQMFGDAGPEPQPAIGNLLTMAGLSLAVASGLHLRLAQYFITSYLIMPAGVLPNPSDIISWSVGQISDLFELAFSLAASFTVAALLYNIALGVINRAMPALMVSFIGAPALTFGGIVLMAVSIPLAMPIWLDLLNNFLASPFVGVP